MYGCDWPCALYVLFAWIHDACWLLIDSASDSPTAVCLWLHQRPVLSFMCVLALVCVLAPEMDLNGCSHDSLPCWYICMYARLIQYVFAWLSPAQ